ncbi:flagellar biosynthetic protein FliR [Roseovarius sp. M141]|uniref:flagellar biosynthetic protein FliR n=1 Tax=Roseovarius sp. M141 TaxID=2583806 RepID=UPI0020CFB36F|nr:flagellar biosynthetic protein FliR [Roseovarius sp. M141]MCQ0091826.1 flagellar biosynthetic protein FliR [Roseovarius sp. M141]
MSGLAELLQISQDLLWLHATVFLRVGPIMALFPGFGERVVPVRVKLVLSLAFTAVVAPAAAPYIDTSQFSDLDIARTVLSETAVGLMIGIGFRMFLLALQTAGSMAAQATSLSQILGAAGATPLPAIGHVLTMGGIALAMILHLHVHVAEMVIATYSIFPVGALPDASSTSQWGVAQVAGAFSLAFSLAAPFVLISVLYNLTLGIINRAMPQMMVVFVGAPVITAGGLVLLFLLAPVMLSIWGIALQGYVANPFGPR